MKISAITKRIVTVHIFVTCLLIYNIRAAFGTSTLSKIILLVFIFGIFFYSFALRPDLKSKNEIRKINAEIKLAMINGPIINSIMMSVFLSMNFALIFFERTDIGVRLTASTALLAAIAPFTIGSIYYAVRREMQVKSD